MELQAENKRCQAELRAMRKAIRWGAPDHLIVMTTCYINTKKVWNHQQNVYLFGYFDNRKAQSKIIYLQKAIEQSESKEQNVQDQLASVIKVVSIIIVKSSQGRN